MVDLVRFPAGLTARSKSITINLAWRKLGGAFLLPSRQVGKIVKVFTARVLGLVNRVQILLNALSRNFVHGFTRNFSRAFKSPIEVSDKGTVTVCIRL